MLRRLTLLTLALAVTATGTASAAVPSVTTGAAVQVTAASARVQGVVNPRGESTTYSFQYGTTRQYGVTTPPAAAGSGTKGVAAFADLAGLRAATVYHYRVVASNASGVVSGNDRTFTTGSIPLGLSLAASPNPVPFGAATSMIGVLSGTGGGGRTVRLQLNAFPFTAGFVNVGNAVVTNADGSFAIPLVGLLMNAQARVITTTGKSLISPTILVGVAPKVRTAVSTRHPRRGRSVRFTGTVTPSWVPAQVAIQRRDLHGNWITIAGVVTRADGASRARYAKSAHIRHTGTYRVFVGLPNSMYAAVVGPSIKLTVR